MRRETMVKLALAPFAILLGLAWGAACFAIVFFPVVAALELLGFVK